MPISAPGVSRAVHQNQELQGAWLDDDPVRGSPTALASRALSQAQLAAATPEHIQPSCRLVGGRGSQRWSLPPCPPSQVRALGQGWGGNISRQAAPPSQTLEKARSSCWTMRLASCWHAGTARAIDMPVHKATAFPALLPLVPREQPQAPATEQNAGTWQAQRYPPEDTSQQETTGPITAGSHWLSPLQLQQGESKVHECQPCFQSCAEARGPPTPCASVSPSTDLSGPWRASDLAPSLEWPRGAAWGPSTGTHLPPQSRQEGACQSHHQDREEPSIATKPLFSPTEPGLLPRHPLAAFPS